MAQRVILVLSSGRMFHVSIPIAIMVVIGGWCQAISPSHESAWIAQALSQYEFRGYERVLEIGCGQGALSTQLAHEVPDGLVLGIDADPAVIAFAERTYDPDLFANLQFQVHDVTEMSFEGKFDVVIAQSALQWIGDQQLALEKIAHALRPEGRLFACLAEPFACVIEAAQKVIAEEKWKEGFAEWEPPKLTFSPTQYREWLAGAQLKPLSLNGFTESVSFSDRAELSRSLREWLPHQMMVSSERREALVNATIDRLLEDHPEFISNTQIVLPRQRLEVEAVKG